MKITTETQFSFIEKESNKNYEINFGTLRKGTDTTVKILFEEASHLDVKKSCGCTAPSIQLLGSSSFELKIQYDKNKTGDVNQWVKERAIDTVTGIQTEIKIELKGKIV